MLAALWASICCRARSSATSRCARSRSMPAPRSSTWIEARRSCATLPSTSPGDALTPRSLRGSVERAGPSAGAGAAAGTDPATGAAVTGAPRAGPDAASAVVPDSPDPAARSAASALTAAAASGPEALTRIASFGRVASSRMAVTDLAFAASAPRSSLTSARKPLAAAATVAAGRACRPCRFGRRISSETAAVSVAGLPSAAAASSSPEVGSIETPSPTVRCANTGSGTRSSGTRTPESGASKATRCGVVVMRAAVLEADSWAFTSPRGRESYPVEPLRRVRLRFGSRAGKGRQALEVRADRAEPRVRLHVDLVATRVVHLRHDAQIGERDVAPVHVPPVPARAPHALLQRAEAHPDPLAHPGIHRVLVRLEGGAQVIEHPQVAERVDVAGDGERERAHLRPICGRARQERRVRMRLLEILDDGERLGDGGVALHDDRDQTFGIDGAKFGRVLGAHRCAQIDQRRLPGDALEAERDAHPIGFGASIVLIELHRQSVR